ncbi:MAG: T9SS type A sorting domain-containing protein [Bacteroidia bacterium]|jgi:hypothetical protein|nr:T9SS type A sorting domain-containing protein [Bacteroidia bacterium]
MKTIFTFLLFLVLGIPKHLTGQNYPSIGAHTVIPEFYGPSTVPTKFVTATAILNQGQHLGTSFTVTPPGASSWLGKIELRGCYYDGQLLPATQTFIDTFHVGILSGGNAYTVTFKAYLSSSSASCIPVDSNEISFFHAVPIVESIHELGFHKTLHVYPNPSKNDIILETANLKGQIIKISDEKGRLVKEVVIEEAQTRVNLNQFNAGVYIYRVMKVNNGILYSGKFVISP